MHAKTEGSGLHLAGRGIYLIDKEPTARRVVCFQPEFRSQSSAHCTPQIPDRQVRRSLENVSEYTFTSVMTHNTEILNFVCIVGG